MIQATSCGGVVIFRGKILVLYKNYKNKYEGWVLPKGTVEPGEEYKDTAAREVLEAVSYTHLDVYKRQAQCVTKGCTSCIRRKTARRYRKDRNGSKTGIP